jgi:hypothetical protein
MKTQETRARTSSVGWELGKARRERHVRFPNPKSCLPGLGATDSVGLVRPLGQFLKG